MTARTSTVVLVDPSLGLLTSSASAIRGRTHIVVTLDGADLLATTRLLTSLQARELAAALMQAAAQLEHAERCQEQRSLWSDPVEYT